MKREDIIMVLLLLAAALCCSCSGNDENRLQEEDVVLNISDADVKGMTAREVHGHVHYFLIVKDYAGSPAHVRSIPVTATTYYEVKHMNGAYAWAGSLGKCPSDTLVYSFVTTPKEYNLDKGIWQDIYSHK